jgi:hypothetical protein
MADNARRLQQGYEKEETILGFQYNIDALTDIID